MLNANFNSRVRHLASFGYPTQTINEWFSLSLEQSVDNYQEITIVSRQFGNVIDCKTIPVWLLKTQYTTTTRMLFMFGTYTIAQVMYVNTTTLKVYIENKAYNIVVLGIK